jgi:hypothetical protein
VQTESPPQEKDRVQKARTLSTVLGVIALGLTVFLCTACTLAPPQRQPLTPITQDFLGRCQTPGVIRCVGFDSPAEVDPHVFPPWGTSQKLGMVDTSIKASGTGSLRFEIPSNSGADTSGSFWLNFADDLSSQFSEGEEFFMQWRQRFSAEFLHTPYEAAGWKQLIVGEGDRPGHSAYSCTQLELVVYNPSHHGFPAMYHSCGGKDGQYEGLLPSGSVTYRANAWMTFQLHVKIGTWYQNDHWYHRDSTVQLWVAHEGRPSTLVVDYSPEPATVFGWTIPGTGAGYDLANTTPGAKYGKVWLLPYNTGKNPAQRHPTAYTWYDELIISRAKLPDPS